MVRSLLNDAQVSFDTYDLRRSLLTLRTYAYTCASGLFGLFCCVGRSLLTYAQVSFDTSAYFRYASISVRLFCHSTGLFCHMNRSLLTLTYTSDMLGVEVGKGRTGGGERAHGFVNLQHAEIGCTSSSKR